MQTLPLRRSPGQDLRTSFEAVLVKHDVNAAFVLQGIGSLSVAQLGPANKQALRLAGAKRSTELRGELEILSLAGSLSRDGAHLHIAVADARGRVVGGHVMAGCFVRTTAEVLLALLPDYPRAGCKLRLQRVGDKTATLFRLNLSATMAP